MKRFIASAKRALGIGAIVLAFAGMAAANQSNTWSPTTGTVSGLQLTANYNNALAALQTCNSGATAPNNDVSGMPVKGQCWLNTSTTPNTVEMYDSANWTTVGWLDTVNHQWIANNAGGTGTIASATTTDLGSVVNPVLTITSTTTIASFGTTALTGTIKYVNFASVLTLTHNATSLILPNGGANIATAAGDTAVAVALGSGNWRVIAYQAASGAALSANSNLTAAVAFTGVISPTALTAGNNNDWAPTGLSAAETIRATPNASNSVLTGLTGGATGRQITLENIGTAVITLAPENAASTAANRFTMAVGHNIRPGQSAAVRYDSTSSRWRLAVPAQRTDPALGFSNLKIVNDSGAPTTTMDVTADAVTVSSLAGDKVNLDSVSVAPVMTSSGANGLDTSSIVNNSITWYAIWVIYNPTTLTTAGLYSLSGSLSGITLPSGYTFGARVGWVRTDGAATARWMRQIQYGRRAQYVVTAATNTLALPNVANGALGTYSSTAPSWAAQSVSNFVPSTAARISLALDNNYKGGSNSQVIVAPNSSYGGTNEATNGSFPPCVNNSASTQQVNFCELMLESTNIYAASTASGAGISAVGWEDNMHHDDRFIAGMLDVANDNDEIYFKPARRAARR